MFIVAGCVSHVVESGRRVAFESQLPICSSRTSCTGTRFILKWRRMLRKKANRLYYSDFSKNRRCAVLYESLILPHRQLMKSGEIKKTFLVASRTYLHNGERMGENTLLLNCHFTVNSGVGKKCQGHANVMRPLRRKSTTVVAV